MGRRTRGGRCSACAGELCRGSWRGVGGGGGGGGGGAGGADWGGCGGGGRGRPCGGGGRGGRGGGRGWSGSCRGGGRRWRFAAWSRRAGICGCCVCRRVRCGVYDGLGVELVRVGA